MEPFPKNGGQPWLRVIFPVGNEYLYLRSLDGRHVNERMNGNRSMRHPAQARHAGGVFGALPSFVMAVVGFVAACVIVVVLQ
jgi:hypothetical protein